jgi:uncharacterized protein (UPF0333 family)
MNKRGQINLSFGMIFSIILIIVFIGFAFYAIEQFLGLQNSIKINTFYSTLQSDVDNVWNSAQANQVKSYDLPTYITQVCFTNTGSQNLIIYEANSRPQGDYNIDKLNITAMTSQGDSCFNVNNGKLSFTLQKNFGNTLVTIQ